MTIEQLHAEWLEWYKAHHAYHSKSDLAWMAWQEARKRGATQPPAQDGPCHLKLFHGKP